MTPGAATNGSLDALRTAATGGLLRLATAGSVDDGKSTLIGRLLYDSKALFEDQLEQVAEASRRRHGDSGVVDLALLTDGLRAEREQGITIDVAYRYFATPKRTFIIADTPGHVSYTRNMVTGASTADLAIVLIDARNGVVQQSRRHAFISSLLRIPHLVVCVNKMDLVDYDEAVFNAIVDEFGSFASKLEITDVTFIPISALHGDNVVERSEHMDWYGGPPLLYHLEHVHIASDRNLIDPRFPVQWVVRPGDAEGEQHDYRGYAGQVAGGVLRRGDDVVILPSGATSRIAAIDTYDGELEEAFPPMSVTLRLEDDIDISRGDMIARPHNHPIVSRDLDALVCWMNEKPLVPGTRYVLKHTTKTVRAVVGRLLHRIDVDTLHRDSDARELALNEIGRIHLRTSAPITYDAYRRNRATGGFILIDEATNETLAAGMLLDPDEPIGEDTAAAARQERSANVVWEDSPLTREERYEALGHRGATVWMTGLPSSGKSTIAGALEQRLVRAGIPAYRLDGDNLRHGLNGNLGFSPQDRAENVRRTAHAAKLLADAGTIAIVSLVSPYAADRELARRVHEDDELPFLEVYVNTPPEECERRDPKGLYAKARAGEITGFTGVDAPYEPPEAPDVELGPGEVEAAVETLVARLRAAGVLPPA
ncbi:MAG: sulfate adenylyltransferase subunit CysN [Solirubrobacteraceae bacterium]|nr:sulfate adenylyltransferase subunit CysN [Solirubrobacteraceae bacterium]